MLEHIGFGDLLKRTNPVKPSIWERLRTFSVECQSISRLGLIIDRVYSLFAKRAQIGSWSIPPTLRSTQNQEYQEVNTGNQKGWCKCRDQA